MRSIAFLLTFAALAGGVFARTGADGVSIETVGLRQMLDLPAYSDMSGITWRGGSNFYVVRDGGNTVSNCVLHTMSVSLDAGGRLFSPPVMSAGIPLAGATDAEGIAFDPCSGMVWISDEYGTRITEYDPATGRPTGRRVPVPAFVAHGVRGNLSLEALTISGDGLTLWTANEEALLCDGGASAPGVATVVRLMRFSRPTATADWVASGMWAYYCDLVGTREPVNSGVSDLCALPDGSLLVLERECSYSTLGRTRIYRPDFSRATNVGGIQALGGHSFEPVDKGEVLCELTDGKRFGDGLLRSQVACYEGLCLGPRNEDGSVCLMLVSDGGASRSGKFLFLSATVETKPFVRALKLGGMDVCTLAFDPPDVGQADRTGSCYRYLRGTEVSVNYDLPGAPDIGSAWTLPAHGLSGDGSRVAFTVTCDDRLSWLTPEALAEREGRRPSLKKGGYGGDLLFAKAAWRPWRVCLGGFGHGGIRMGIDGFGSGRTSVYGAVLDCQVGLARHGPYEFWFGAGGSYCPSRDDVFDARGRAEALARGRMDLGYGELRLMSLSRRRMTEDFSVGLRMGVAFGWLDGRTMVFDGGMTSSDSSTEFAAQGILGVQATYSLTDRLGLYTNVDWRFDGTSEFETGSGKATVEMSGWLWSVGMAFSF